jgi:hypothetical protein
VPYSVGECPALGEQKRAPGNGERSRAVHRVGVKWLGLVCAAWQAARHG